MAGELWPALLATAHGAGGRTALLVTVPLAGVVSVLALCAVLRRVGDELLGPRRAGGAQRGTAGLVAAGAGGLLLATNQLQVWQARYPTTEVLAQARPPVAYDAALGALARSVAEPGLHDRVTAFAGRTRPAAAAAHAAPDHQMTS